MYNTSTDDSASDSEELVTFHDMIEGELADQLRRESSTFDYRAEEWCRRTLRLFGHMSISTDKPKNGQNDRIREGIDATRDTWLAFFNRVLEKLRAGDKAPFGINAFFDAIERPWLVCMKTELLSV